MNIISWILVVLLVASIILCAILCSKYTILKESIVKVSDKKPKGNTTSAKVMQLANELEDYLVETDDEVALYVVAK